MVVFNKYMKNKLVISYDITDGCNLRCPYCYMLTELENTKIYNTEIADMVINALYDFQINYPDYIIELDILGGDPLYCDNLFEFLDKLFSKVTLDVFVVTNLVPNDKSKLTTLKEYLIKYDTLGVAATWHDQKSDEWKENIQEFLDLGNMVNHCDEITVPKVCGSFVLGVPNIYDKYLYLKSLNLEYYITHVFYETGAQHRTFRLEDYDEKTLEIYYNSVDFKNKKFTLDNTKIDILDYEKHELYEVSNKHPVVCSILNYNIDFQGIVENSCNYKPRIRYHIKDGIKPYERFCKNFYCQCSGSAHKRISGASIEEYITI